MELQTKAFSLFELLIVIAIIGILAAIGYPLYNHHIAKVNHQRAKIILLEIASHLEESHSVSGSYKSTPINTLIPAINSNLPYRFSVAKLTKETFTIQATPSPKQATNDSCGVISVDNQGQHQPLACW